MSAINKGFVKIPVGIDLIKKLVGGMNYVQCRSSLQEITFFVDSENRKIRFDVSMIVNRREKDSGKRIMN